MRPQKLDQLDTVVTFRCTAVEAHLVRAVAASEHNTVSELLRDLVAARAKRLFETESHQDYLHRETQSARLGVAPVSNQHGRAQDPHGDF